MACLPQFGSVPAAYAVSLTAVIGLANNDVNWLRPLRQFRVRPSKVK